MKLVSVEITKYLSVLGPQTLLVDPKMTVLVGANDHGKSNILQAIRHMDPGTPVEPDKTYRGRRLDPSQKPDLDQTRLVFTTRLEPQDGKVKAEALRLLASDDFLRSQAVGDPDLQEVSADLAAAKDAIADAFGTARVDLVRFGGETELTWLDGSLSGRSLPYRSACEAALARALLASLPRVVYFDTPPALPYRVPIDQLRASDDPVLEGFLGLGGAARKRETLCDGTSRAGRSLREQFEGKLNREFRRIYKQSARVKWNFALTEQDTLGIIEVTDESQDRAAPSEKSLGFRSFLAYTLALLAKTGEADPSGCIIVVDEPDLHLHPRGQKDLLRFLERLADRNQVIFATHSPFMVPRRYPARVRHVRKDAGGTAINSKPFAEAWGPVVADLGLAAADFFRFADRVLVVEGRSDHLILQSLMQWAAERGAIALDLDAYAFRDAEGSGNVPAVVDALDDGTTVVAALLDNDRSGQRVVRRLKAVNKRKLKAATVAEIVGDTEVVTVEDTIPRQWFQTAVKEAYTALAEQGFVGRAEVEGADWAGFEQRLPAAGRRAFAESFIKDAGVIEEPKDFSPLPVAYRIAALAETGAPTDDDTQALEAARRLHEWLFSPPEPTPRARGGA